MKITPAIIKLEVNKIGKVNIKIRIANNKTTRYISTRFDILPTEWEKGQVIGHINAAFINLELKSICLDYEKRLFPLNIDDFSASRIVEVLTTKNDIRDFTAFYLQFIEKKRTINAGTTELYERTLKKIQKYDSRKPILFEDINPGWLEDFEADMKKEGMKKSSIAIHMKNIKSVFNRAINFNIVPLGLYPFRRYKIEYDKETEKRAVTLDEIRLIRDFKSPWPATQMSADIFMLSFYLAGINSVDLYGLTGITGNGRILYERAKTHRKYSIKVEPEARELIEKLKGKKKFLIFQELYPNPHNLTCAINKGLKRMNIVEGLQYYSARHTFATIAKNEIYRDVEKVVVSKIDKTKTEVVKVREHVSISDEQIGDVLGHTKKTVTSGYIKRTTKDVDDLVRQVLDAIK